MGTAGRRARRIARKWGLGFAVWLGAMAATGAVTAALALPVWKRGALTGGTRVERVQDESGNIRIAVAGRKLVVRGDPKGAGPVVGHVENGAQVIVVETQGGMAKVKDYQTGRVLGWVNRALLLNPSQ